MRFYRNFYFLREQDYTSGGIWIKRDEIPKRTDNIQRKKAANSENPKERTKRGRRREKKKQENVKPVT